MTNTQKPRALLSVFRKEGLKELAEALVESNYELVCSGGTAALIQAAHLPVTPVEVLTGNPEAFDGKMKTISFQIESAILFDRTNATHKEQVQRLGILPIDVVVCNFYPFEKAIKEDLPLEEALSLIDVGGPTMVRAAAKNFKHVLVLTDPADYPGIEQCLRKKQVIPFEERLRLACKAFQMTASYDAQIDAYFHGKNNREIQWFRFQDGQTLRYGENPHQEASVFWSIKRDSLSLASFKKASGKELSFNNILDANAAINTLSLLGSKKPACVIVKHANPCGAAFGAIPEEAFEKAWQGDPLAAFGGIIALNSLLTFSLAEQFLSEKKFAEIFLCPEIENRALELFIEKKKNLIVLANPALYSPALSDEADFKKIRSGILIQEPDLFIPSQDDLDVVSSRKPTAQEWEDLLFAWKIGKESKSNSIILAKNEQLVGSGVGQQDRVRACKLAIEKAGNRAHGSCAASDAFFPFSDGPEILIHAGVAAILHPGGSIRDDETITLCNEHNVALVTTRGKRAFKH